MIIKILDMHTYVLPCMTCLDKELQWNLYNTDTLGPAIGVLIFQVLLTYIVVICNLTHFLLLLQLLCIFNVDVT